MPAPSTGTPAPPTPTLPKAPVPTVPAPGRGDSAQMGEAFNSLDSYLTPGFGESAPEPQAQPAAPAKEGSDLDPSKGLVDAPPATPPSTGSTSPKTDKKEPGASSAGPKDTKPDPKPSKEEGKPEQDVPPEQMTPADLRKAYNRLRNRYSEMENKLKAESEKPKSEQDDVEKKSMRDELTQLRDRMKAIDEERTLTDFEHSQAYQKEYWEPYVATFTAGREAVAGLNVVDPESGETRQATSEDFDTFMRITDKNAALQYAQDVFGNGQAVAMFHREQVIRENVRREQAIEQNKTMAKEHFSKAQKQAQENNARVEAAFKKHVAAAADKFPHWFKPTEGESLDPKVNEALDRGMKLVDRLYGSEPLKPEEAVALHAAVRNKAGAFDRVAYELAQAKNRIKELQEKVDAFEKSEPGPGTPGRRPATGAPGEMDWQTRLDKYSSAS